MIFEQNNAVEVCFSNQQKYFAYPIIYSSQSFCQNSEINISSLNHHFAINCLIDLLGKLDVMRQFVR